MCGKNARCSLQGEVDSVIKGVSVRGRQPVIWENRLEE